MTNQMKVSSNFGKKLSNYIMDLQNKLGEGQYGDVYTGYQIDTKEIVAIKMIATKPQNKALLEELFDKEVKVMAGLDHPNLVKYKNSFKTENNLYIVMEYCEGGTINEYIAQKCKKQNIKYLAESEARIILREIVKGYKHLYDNKIVHRDLKSTNILMKKGKPKISDFGFGKILQNFDTDLLKTLAGTPHYMSPQLLNSQQYTSKTDIWSLGIIFYEILFGEPPIQGNLEEMKNSVKSIELNFPNNHPVSKEMRDIITKMLQTSEKDRMSWEELFNLQYFIDEDVRKKIQESLIKIKNEQNQFIKKNLERILYIQNYGQNLEHARQQQQEIELAYPIILNNESDSIVLFNSLQNISFDSQEYNQLRKNIYNEISDWINHKRNKSLFLNNLIKYMLELSQNRQLKQDIHMDFVVGFTITKYQILILYKMYNRLEKKSLEKENKLQDEDWKKYCQTQDYVIAYQTIKNDYNLIKSVLVDYIEPTTNSLKELNNPILNQVQDICNFKLVIKQKMNQIFDSVITYFFQKVKSQVNINQLSLEYLQFLVNLKNCSKIHSEFKFKYRFDFFKYNDELMNQTRENLINFLQ